MTTTTITDPKVAENIKEDRFELGWRYVPRPLPNGDYFQERVPLTLEDILHPEVGDFRLHTQDHERFCVYLYDVFKACLTGDPTAIVLHDVRVAWAEPEIKAHGPDVSVIFGVKEQRDWATFDEKEEGTKPTLIVEVTSPKTRQVDLVDKFDEYAQVGLQFYIIIDTHKHRGETVRRLLGYGLTETGYEMLIPDEQNRLWLQPLQIWLGIEDNEPRCYDQTGQPIGDYTQVSEALAAEAKARAEAETQAAAEAKARADAEARLQALEAELRRLRGDEG